MADQPPAGEPKPADDSQTIPDPPPSSSNRRRGAVNKTEVNVPSVPNAGQGKSKAAFWKTPLLLVLVAVITGAGGWFGGRSLLTSGDQAEKGDGKKGPPPKQAELQLPTVKVSQGIGRTLTAKGKISGSHETVVSPVTGGKIATLPFQSGASVKAGDRLLEFDPSLFVLQVQLAQGELDELTRKKEPPAPKATPEEVRRAENLVKDAKKAFQQSVLYAPIDGVVSYTANEVKVGKTGLTKGQLLFTIYDPSSLKVEIAPDAFSAKDQAHLKKGMDARFSYGDPKQILPVVLQEFGKDGAKLGFKEPNSLSGELIGKAVDVEIDILKNESVLVVSRSAIYWSSKENVPEDVGKNLDQKKDVHSFLLSFSDGKTLFHPVTLGEHYEDKVVVSGAKIVAGMEVLDTAKFPAALSSLVKK